MNKICVIITWYGEFPTYFSFFLKSCEFNKGIIDILIFSDTEYERELPNNVRIHKMSFDNLKKLIIQKTGFEVKINNAYKLCDYKPMYGHIFEDYIDKYDFWGYGDIDIIYGDLKKYLPKKILENYDIFTFREYIISGAFTILRNNEYIKKLYSTSKHIKLVYENGKYIDFDEAGEKRELCRKRIPAYELFYMDDFQCWTSIVQYAADNMHLRLYARYELKESLPFESILKYKYGEILLEDLDEFIGYHFVSEKRTSKFIIPNWKSIPDEFHITPTGIYTDTNTIQYFFIRKYRILYGIFKKTLKRMIDSINWRLKLNIKAPNF